MKYQAVITATQFSEDGYDFHTVGRSPLGPLRATPEEALEDVREYQEPAEVDIHGWVVSKDVIVVFEDSMEVVNDPFGRRSSSMRTRTTCEPPVATSEEPSFYRPCRSRSRRGR